MSGDICGDNRFEVIEKCKQKLIEATNIETSPDEMAVLDSILFRFWQMGWLPAAEPEKRTEERTETHACDLSKGKEMLDIKEYLKQTKTVLLTQDAFDELMQRAYAQPEPCEDAVSRKLVIRAFTQLWSLLKTVADRDEWEDICRTTANILRPVTQEPRWISCSERLPEEDGQYLITVKYKPEADYEDIYAEHGEWTDGRWDMFCFGHCGEVEDIIAWMPLPKPYWGE